jgi:predicted GNAT superfamily acetyltransferase
MEDIVIRECIAIDELDNCVRLQREVFGLPDLEISPRRHLIVSRQAGGWTLGAFVDKRLVGFVHHLAAVRGEEVFGYSHMMAVDPAYQNKGVGARLKWGQRERAIQEGRSFIKWTWDPMQARNAYFNLNRLGVTVSRRVKNLADGATASAENLSGKPQAMIDIPANWTKLCNENPRQAKEEQFRVRQEFQSALASGLVAAAFERSGEHPRYLLYRKEAVSDQG